MKMDACICVTLVTSVFFMTYVLGAPATPSTPHTYAANGIVCNACPPGLQVEKHCEQNFQNSTCVPCPVHQYMNKWNEDQHCTACKLSCPKNGREVQACSRTTNRQCFCDLGFHRFPMVIDDHWTCEPHNPCEPGYGEKSFGNHSHDTVCEKCEVGQEFVNTSDVQHPRCQPCSQCLTGTSPLSNCNITTDTVCNPNATQDTTAQDFPTETPPDDGKDSNGLGGWAIFGIVIGFILLLAIVGVLIAWFTCRNQLSACVGAVIAVITCRKRRQRSSSSGDQGNNPRAQNVDVELPLIKKSWTEQFIERKVCLYLSTHLGEEWRRFITQLPGWPEGRVNAVIEHKIEEETSVPNRIMGCLKEWMKMANPADICKESIVDTLLAVEKREIVEELEAKESQLAQPVENGQ